MKFYNFNGKLIVDLSRIKSIHKDFTAYPDGNCNDPEPEYYIVIVYRDGTEESIAYNNEKERDKDYLDFCNFIKRMG